jgi:hypothetical protein
MPTGCGKTRAFCTLAAQLGWPTLVLVHRDELVRQTVDELGETWPSAVVGVVKAERNEWATTPAGCKPDAVVASVQSLHANRLAEMPADRFGLVIADEAHHAVAPTWARVLDHFSSRFILGCTATPERADGKGLAERFGERPLYSYALRRAIEDDHLVRLRQYAIDTAADLDGVCFRAGDFAGSELSAAVNTPERNRVVVEAYQKHAPERRAVVFCVDVQHATDMASAFNRAGIAAGCVVGDTPTDERRQLLRDFGAGNLRVVTNCAVLTEGFDDRGIGAVLMARPTCSRALYTQCIGRGLRKANGKVDCVVLDFADNSRRHKIVTALDLLGAVTARNAQGHDVVEVCDADRAEAERRKLVESTCPLKWRRKAVSPWPELPNLSGYAPSEAWHGHSATGPQVRYLGVFGLNVTRRLTKGEASYLISRALEYEAAYPTPATGAQRGWLKRRGVWRDGMSKREACRLIGEMKAGGTVATGAGA